jgi:citrate lyase beta subunit
MTGIVAQDADDAVAEEVSTGAAERGAACALRLPRAGRRACAVRVCPCNTMHGRAAITI